MNFVVRSSRPFSDAWRIVAAHPLRAIVPAAIVAVAGLAYAVWGPETWQASWAVQIRDEAIGSRDRLGKFASVDSMKTAQETIQQLAKSELVVAAALRAIGPPENYDGAEWPDAAAIRETQDAIAIDSPKGTEFGKTELLFIRAKAESRERAIALDEALCAETERQLQSLRRARAESLTDELDQRVVVARAELDDATERLAAIESEVGGDLGELRLLNEAGAGESNLRHTLVGVKTELRQATLKRASREKLLEMLDGAADDPTLLVAAPNELLESLPTLRQLKDGMVAARLRLAEATSRMTEAHPLVRSDRIELEQIQSQIKSEIAAATIGLQAELDLTDIAIGSLDAERIDLETRMTRVANLRAKYGNVARETERQGELLADAIRDLIDARSQYAAAETTSVLTFIGSPTTGGRPLPPGRMTVAGIALLASVFVGLGCVALTVPWRFTNEVELPAETPGAAIVGTDSPAAVEAIAEERSAGATETLDSPAPIEVFASASAGGDSDGTIEDAAGAASIDESGVAAHLAASAVSEASPEPTGTANHDDEEIEIPTHAESVAEPPMLPGAVRNRAHGVDLSDWGPFPDLFADDPRAPWIPVEPQSEERSTVPLSMSDTVDAETIDAVGSEDPLPPADSILPDPPARRVEGGVRRPGPWRQPRLYPGMDARRKLSLRQALVTISRRRGGRP